MAETGVQVNTEKGRKYLKNAGADVDENSKIVRFPRLMLEVAVAVARQIDMENDEVEIVQSGSIFAGGDLLNQSMCSVITQHLSKARIIRLEAPPVIGPVIMGMQIAGVRGYSVRGSLIRSVDFFRKWHLNIDGWKYNKPGSLLPGLLLVGNE